MIYYDEMECAFLEKNSLPKTLKIAKNEAGQSLVEYLLVLVVTVILILGLMAQFYKPFSRWITSYMGPYLECLLDVGELPTFGSSSASGLCAAEFKAGSGIYSPTKPIPVNSAGNNSGGTEGSANSSKNSSSGAGGSSSSDSSSYRMKGFLTSKSTGADGPPQAASGGEVSLSQTRYFHSGGSTGEVASRRSTDVVGSASLGMSERERLKKDKEKTFNVEAFDSTAGLKKKKLELKEGDRKPTSEEKETPWTFSSYLKFAVILMIIVAIVLFLGGQILQISKSMEKD